MEKERLISPLQILQLIKSKVFIFYFLFSSLYFLGNQTWVVRKNPSPCLAHFMSSRDANRKVKNLKEE